MGVVKTGLILLVSTLFVLFLCDIFCDGDLSDAKIPDTFWGPKEFESGEEDTKIYPFKIHVDDEILTDLKSTLSQELNSSRYVPPLEGQGFQYGFNTDYLQEILQYWITDYDWKEREKIINEYPHFKTKISGIDIHFQHIKSPNNSKYKETKTLLLIHGWPGSFVEFQKVIPLLTEPEQLDFNFELIIPSMPGYGYSEAAVRPGLGVTAAAQIFLKLMDRLSFDQFYVQGGDWGSAVATNMATLYPERVSGLHSNLCFSTHPRSHIRIILSSFFPSWTLTPEEISRFMPISDYYKFILGETGYGHIQASKPDTIGVALSMSPSGLAAYILEKFSTWTNMDGVSEKDGGLPKHFVMEDLLDNVMVYWVTNSITTSMRFYSEFITSNEFSNVLNRVPVQVPVGCVVSNDPYVNQGKWILQDKYPNIVHYSMTNEGGHFLSLEQPNVLADDVLNFVRVVHSQKVV